MTHARFVGATGDDRVASGSSRTRTAGSTRALSRRSRARSRSPRSCTRATSAPDRRCSTSSRAIAPVTAVLGNCDAPIPGFDLGRDRAAVASPSTRILVIHDFADLGPIPDDVDVVVRGHSHIPSVQWHGRRARGESRLGDAAPAGSRAAPWPSSKSPRAGARRAHRGAR